MAAGVAPISASSGKVQRHRLNRGGNRQLNFALFTAALVQSRCDPRGRSYLERKRAEGKSWKEAMRCLKRQLANVVDRQMIARPERGTLGDLGGRYGLRGSGFAAMASQLPTKC